VSNLGRESPDSIEERRSIRFALQIRSHNLPADPSRRGVGNNAFEALPYLDADMPGAWPARLPGHQQHHDPSIPSRIPYLGLGSHLPLASDGKRHLGWVLLPDRRKRHHGNLGSGSCAKPLDQILHRGRRLGVDDGREIVDKAYRLRGE
jgi:hypothetical protein